MIEFFSCGQPLKARSIGIHDVNIGIAAFGTPKGDLFAVRRGTGPFIFRRRLRQIDLMAAVRVHGEDFPVAGALTGEVHQSVASLGCPGGDQRRQKEEDQ